MTTAKLTAIHVNGQRVPLPHGPVAISAADRLSIERGAVVVRHGKRHRATARVPLGDGSPVVLDIDTPGPVAESPCVVCGFGAKYHGQSDSKHAWSPRIAPAVRVEV